MTNRPCERCVAAIQAAADVLRELQALEPWLLPNDTDWTDVQRRLARLAGHLRRQGQD